MRGSDKSERLSTIVRLVAEHSISGQEELLELLRHEGHSVTQATLSRDIKALNIVKAPDGAGGYHYTMHRNVPQQAISRGASPISMMGSGLESIEISGQMCVIHTLPGYANVAAAIIDDGDVPYLMGTIAGDDTVLLALRADAKEDEVRASLNKILPAVD